MSKKEWPENCIWPKPSNDHSFWEAEDADSMPLDEDGEDLLEAKDYMDELVEEGRLNDDYSLNEDYDEEDFIPEKGTEYWYDNRFDIEAWEEDMAEHLSLLKLPLPSPVSEIQRIIGYEFINENLLRQAFTRRAFGIEYGVGNNETLEFLGDTVITTVVTREIIRQQAEERMDAPGEPFSSMYSEGDMTKIRQHYVCKEYLSERAAAFGLDKYILFGTGEAVSESSREDMMEALVGAVAVDCEWTWDVLESVVDALLCIQCMRPDDLLKDTYYEIFNAWHQRRFGQMPDYEVSRYCYCTLRFFVPENDKRIHTSQRVDVKGESRSRARELAAREAYGFVVNNGLWMNLKDAGIEPDLDNSINQLQELYQKKYVEEKPIYEFEERAGDEWYCSCICGGLNGWGKAIGKTMAKKKASFMVIVRMMMSAGICRKEWERAMWKTLEDSSIRPRLCTSHPGDAFYPTEHVL